jgi:predicted RNase H-like nuclease
MQAVGEVFVGIDLAWSSGMTGLAAVDPAGRVLTSASVRTDEQIDDWVSRLPGQPLVVAVDAPLVVPNQSGSRDGERQLARAFSRYGAAPYTTSRARLGTDEPRAMALARRHGWATDPTTPAGGRTPVCIEVYPHPALVGLFALPYRLPYKKGPRAARAEALHTLAEHLETVPELHLATHPRWAQVRAMLTGPKPGDLDRWEDEIDAIVCAHLAWLWRHRPGHLTVYGTPAGGYIVAPPPPTHPAAPPSTRRAPGPSAAARRRSGQRQPGGRALDDA